MDYKELIERLKNYSVKGKVLFNLQTVKEAAATIEQLVSKTDELEKQLDEAHKITEENYQFRELTKMVSIDRLRELVQADSEKRCVVLQSQYSETTGGEALRRAMYTCSVTNNEITRYTTDAIVEKVVRESKEMLKKLEGEKKHDP